MDVTASELWDLFRTKLTIPAANRFYDPAPGGYPSWKAVMGASVVPIANMIRLMQSAETVPANTQGEAQLAMRAAVHDFPLFWVDASLLESILRSDPPEEYASADLKWPFPAMAFLLPTGTLSHATDGDCSWLMIGALQGQVTCPISGATFVSASRNIFAYTMPWAAPNPAAFNFGIPLADDFFPFKPLPDFGRGNVHNMRDPDKSDKVQFTADDRTFTELMMQLGLRLVLALSARPELMDAAAPSKIVKAKGTAKEFAKPRWIGHGYSIKVEGGDALGGNVRLHWRRGHFRNQPHGEGRSLRKLIWIQPHLAGGE